MWRTLRPSAGQAQQSVSEWVSARLSWLPVSCCVHAKSSVTVRESYGPGVLRSSLKSLLTLYRYSLVSRLLGTYVGFLKAGVQVRRQDHQDVGASIPPPLGTRNHPPEKNVQGVYGMGVPQWGPGRATGQGEAERKWAQGRPIFTVFYRHLGCENLI